MTASIMIDGYAPYVLLAVGAVVVLCWQRLSVHMDPQEPRLLKPTVPYIGHIIGLIKHQSGYFDKLNAASPMPACTIPMINAKIYLLYSPKLVQSVFRSKTISFEPFVIDFAQKMLGVSDETMKPITAPATDKPTFLTEFFREVHVAMTAEHLHKMNAHALGHVSTCINNFGQTFETGSLYIWIRTMMTLATSKALFGSHDPLNLEPKLVDALWDFEGGIMSLLLGVPAYFSPKPYAGRAVLQTALIEYYAAKHDLDNDVARLTQARAAFLRKRGIPDTDIGKFELALLHVSTSNAIPTSFWTLAFIAASPSLVALIREEVQSITTISTAKGSKKREASLNISRLSTNCPLLVSSYRESQRLSSTQVGQRRVMADTVISDGSSRYLLKKGADVQMPSGVNNLSTAIWGKNVAEFDPRRFLQPEEKGLKSDREKFEDKEQKKSFVPFGGGTHLCPGRNFAFAEILGTVAVLLSGFEITGTDGGTLKIPKIGRGSMAESISKPTGEGLELGAIFTRREGWEDVTWGFTTDQEVGESA